MELFFSKASPADMNLWKICGSGKYANPADPVCLENQVNPVDPVDREASVHPVRQISPVDSMSREASVYPVRQIFPVDLMGCVDPVDLMDLEFRDGFSGKYIRFLKLFFNINLYLLKKYFILKSAQYLTRLKGILFFPAPCFVFLKSYRVCKKNLKTLHGKLFKLYCLINFISY